MTFRVGKIFGFPIEIDWTWFVVFALVVWAIKQGLIMRFAQGQYPDSLLLLAGIVGGLLFFASLLGHELAHCWVAREKGIPIAGITLFIFGGVARMKSEPESPGDEIKMALAGPLFSIVAAAFFYLVWGADILPRLWNELVRYLAIANLVVAIFNLIPAFPSDGGRALRAIIWGWSGSLSGATRVAAGLGQVFGWTLVFLGFLQVLQANWGGIWFVLIGYFLQDTALRAAEQAQWRKAIGGLRISDVMNRNPVTIPPDVSVEEAVHNYFLREPSESLPVVWEGQPVGILRISDLRNVEQNEWPTTQVRNVMSPISGDCFVSISDDAWEVLSGAAQICDPPLLVVDEGQLVGIVTQETLSRQIQLRMRIRV